MLPVEIVVWADNAAESAMKTMVTAAMVVPGSATRRGERFRIMGLFFLGTNSLNAKRQKGESHIYSTSIGRSGLSQRKYPLKNATSTCNSPCGAAHCSHSPPR